MGKGINLTMLSRRFLLLLGKNKTWQEQLLNLFPGGSDVGIRLDKPSYSYFRIYQQIYQNRYWKINVGPANFDIGNDLVTLGEKTFCDLYNGYSKNTTPAVTQGGGAWTWSAGNNYLGGGFLYNVTAGWYLEISVPNSVTLGAFTRSAQSSYGIALVSIDGDNTLADLCQTAQDLVDTGVCANTILVANGGTLNPTDRVWDLYNLTSNYDVTLHGGGSYYKLFTSSLDGGTHTIRLTVTGYKNTSSSGVGVYVICLFGGGTSSRPGTGADFLLPVETMVTAPNGAADEISYSFRPTGTAATAWLGHTGQAKSKSAPVVTMDGVTITPAYGVCYNGSELTISVTADVRHPETGATNQGLYDLSYKLNKSSGLWINHTLTWLSDGTVQGYPCMWTVDHAIYDRYKTYQNNEIDLTDQDSSLHLNSTKNICWCWDLDGTQATLMYIPNLLTTVDNWANSLTNQLVWMDFPTGGNKKAYTCHYFPAFSYLTNAVIVSEANYRVNWFPGGANAVLAGKY